MRSLALFSRRGLDEPAGQPSTPAVPAGFDAVAEAVLAGESAVAAGAVAGSVLARDGVCLGEALSGLAETFRTVSARAPDYLVVEALAVAWSEVTLDLLAGVTCEDPLSGLASAPHLRTRLTEVYRAAERAGLSVRTTHALVVVDVPRRPGSFLSAPAFGRSLGLAAVAEVLREELCGDVTLARLGVDRVAALVLRGPALGTSVAGVREKLARLPLPAPPSVWIEGLPGQPELAVRLLTELDG